MTQTAAIVSVRRSITIRSGCALPILMPGRFLLRLELPRLQIDRSQILRLEPSSP